MIKHPFMKAWKILLATCFAVLLFTLTPDLTSAQTPTPGPHEQRCIAQYGVGNCTANDFGVQEVILWHVYTACGADPAHPGQAEVDFEVVFSSSNSTRYDVGLFMALDGGSAITGINSCHHAYLDGGVTTAPFYMVYYTTGETPPFPANDVVENPAPIYTPAPTPSIFYGWWDGDGDTCGDMEPQTQTVIRYTGPIWMSCNDSDGNGIVDLHVCGSYDNNGKPDCFSVANAYPGTTAKCGCMTVNLDFTPTVIEGLTFTASSSVMPTSLILSGLGLILLSAGLLSLFLRRRAQTR